jgi:peroxiredoxin
VTAHPRHSPIQPGEPAPDFELPAASGSGAVSLARYRAEGPVCLALLRGIY